MIRLFISTLLIISTIIHPTIGLSSPIKPFTNYPFSTELQTGIADLWWSIDETRREITFELHAKTTGWIALGISPAGGMNGADIGLGWVDTSGALHFEDRFSTGPTQPVRDRNSSDWVGIRGREENGWTAIQSRRPIESCDSMDVSIKSGTNIVIYAYGLEDPEMNNGLATIRYHQNRRSTRIIPLQSYANPPAESKFDGLDYFEFKLKNYKVPMDATTYHCQIYKVPTNYPKRRHAIAYKALIEQGNEDIVHHLLLYECDATSVFDDNNLPNDLCDKIINSVEACSMNIATGWAVGGDYIFEYPEVAGYPVGGDFEIKYYMVQMHYDNPHQMTNRTDSSGIRFYLGNETRQHELGYLSLGSISAAAGIAIPPRMDKFIIDNYCPSAATQRIPKDGITVFSAFPHTHLQGRSLWTKVIRDRKAVEYLFNAESYDFNYQFGNILPKPIKLYPGDELATRCVYQTTNKTVVTLGGESTTDEMCLHMFAYYPRMKDFYTCFTMISMESWLERMNATGQFSFVELVAWLRNIRWDSSKATDWQKFFEESKKSAVYGTSTNANFTVSQKDPVYEDLRAKPCSKNKGDRLQSPIFFLSFSMALLTYGFQ